MAATKTKRLQTANSRVWLYSTLLTLQYGVQPLISKRFVRREVIVTSSVLVCEIIKVICALILIAREGGLRRLFKEWTFVGSLTTSGLPAAIYALQNSLQLGCKWISLLAEILAALHLYYLAWLLLFVNGLLRLRKHASYVMTVEMSIVGSLCLLASTFKSPDGEAIIQHGLFYGWTPLTLIPVIFNALGGILVGLVTSYAGGVRKGFVIVSALLVTASLQFIFDGKPPSLYCLLAFPLVISSISIYQKYPYPVKKKES
ncbi:nucleotide-sugar transporter family protein [Actinidia rufa]|uniref:Nucleotide-sugar transporter family protein n=1 Tax=Actinidia rufa TaxID=165716 RepID=A0A7J0E286_9ERIC|nr:nucleotide-sugar transporter family protein [Actinidia rufa]